MLLTDTGGHVTFYHGILNPKRWFIQRAIDYYDTIYEILTNK